MALGSGHRDQSWQASPCHDCPAPRSWEWLALVNGQVFPNSKRNTRTRAQLGFVSKCEAFAKISIAELSSDDRMTDHLSDDRILLPHRATFLPRTAQHTYNTFQNSFHYHDHVHLYTTNKKQPLNMPTKSKRQTLPNLSQIFASAESDEDSIE